MKILFIANCVSIYGANRSMLDLAVALKKIGNDLFFFLPLKGTKEEMQEINSELEKNGFLYAYIDYNWSVHASISSKQLECATHVEVNARCISVMEEYANKWKIDLIHTNSFTHTIGAELAQRVNMPHVWHIREALKEDYDLLFDDVDKHKEWVKKADKVICISEYVRKVHSDLLSETNSEVMYNGFAIANYDLDAAYDKSPAIFNILLCGVIRESKGQLEAIKAVHRLVEEYECRNVHLKIIGGGSGDYFRDICNYIEDNSLSLYIEIIPYQKDLREFRRKADISLMCSRNEALGRVTIESMLSENVVIGANSAGTAELIRDGVNGYLYEVGNVDDLCQKILFVMQNWEVQGEVIKNAKQFVYANFDVGQYAARISRIYEELCRTK